MRKLGFEETPDYDFLRELFSKVLKSSGEYDDGVYDWMMLNGGKGWEAGTHKDRRDDRDRRHDPRASKVVHGAPQAPQAAAAADRQQLNPTQSQAQIQRSPSQQRKSAVPPQVSGEGARAHQAQQQQQQQQQYHRSSHGDMPHASSFGNGVGASSNIAVHDATIAGLPGQSPGAREHSHGGALTPTGMQHSSTGGIEGGRRVDGRGPVGGGGAMNGDGQPHPAERQSFGSKLVRILTCRCG